MESERETGVAAHPSTPVSSVSVVKSGYCGLTVYGKRGPPLIRSSIDPSSSGICLLNMNTHQNLPAKSDTEAYFLLLMYVERGKWSGVGWH